MHRFAVVLLLGLGVAACGQQGPSLEGSWGVGDQADCEGNADTFVFDGSDFYQYRDGTARVTGTELAYTTSDAEDGVRVSAIYNFNGGVHQLTFSREGDNVLIFRGATIDGQVSQPAESARGLRLYRCGVDLTADSEETETE